MITRADIGKEIEHHFFGNALTVCQWINDEYVRVVGVGKEEIGKQAFLAWTKMLKPLRPLTPETHTLAQKLFSDLESGKAKIRNTHIVYAR